MPEKSPIEKLQDAVAEVVRGAVADPAGTAAKAAEQVRGAVSLGFMVFGQVTQTVADKLLQTPTPPPSAPKPPIVDPDRPTPADVARVVELKPTPAKKAPPKKAPPKKAPAKKTPGATPSAKLPVKKAPARKAPAKKAAVKKAAVKKAAVKKAAVKETPAKKAPAKKAPASGTES